MKYNDVKKIIEKNGWVYVRQSGSHVIYKKDGEADIISLPNHGKTDLKPGTLNSILKTAGVKK